MPEGRSKESVAVLWSGAYFFLLLQSYYLLRPLRETVGVEAGQSQLPFLFTWTFVGMLVAIAIYGYLVSRFQRRQFIPWTNGFFASNILVFYGLYLLVPEEGEDRLLLGKVFFVWLSIFNLFVVAVFRGFMVDLFSLHQGKKLFGFIAAGGTLGAIFGSTIASFFVVEIGQTNLFLLAALLMLLTIVCVLRLNALFPRVIPAQDAKAAALARGSILQGIKGSLHGMGRLFRSPQLAGISLYMIMGTMGGTFLYYQQTGMVGELLQSGAERTEYFAQVNLVQNCVTLVFELLGTWVLLRYVGLTAGLVILPLVHLLGFTALYFEPTLLILASFNVLSRSCRYAFAVPARDVMFTIMSREEKYTAKGFIETAVYRGGDVAFTTAADMLKAVARPGVVLFGVILPACLGWTVLAFVLGHLHRRRLQTQSVAEAKAAKVGSSSIPPTGGMSGV